jgi:hypothetical protein
MRVRIAAVSAEVLAWNTGPAGAVTGALGVRDPDVAGAGPDMVIVAVGVGRAWLADVPPGDGRGTPGVGGCVPAHPAASRPTATAAITAMTVRAGRRSGQAAV